MPSENTIEITDENFEKEVLQSNKPVLVDFWAEWCMPCRMIAPAVDELADEYKRKIRVGMVNTDENRGISVQVGISAIPTIILFKDGQMVRKFVGLQQKEDLKAALDEVLES